MLFPFPLVAKNYSYPHLYFTLFPPLLFSFPSPLPFPLFLAPFCSLSFNAARGLKSPAAEIF